MGAGEWEWRSQSYEGLRVYKALDFLLEPHGGPQCRVLSRELMR